MGIDQVTNLPLIRTLFYPLNILFTMNRSLIRSFWTQVVPLPEPTGDFTGKTVIVTGANTGLGLEAARHFAKLNASKVILGCRDLEKAEAARRGIQTSLEGSACELETWKVDLGSFSSVQSFCRRAADLERLDVVIENAGLLSHVYHEFEGYERQCTINVISTWLMALLLLPTMRRTSLKFDGEQGKDCLPHLCIVGSNAQFYTTFEQRNEPRIFESLREDGDMFHRYANTKLLSLLVMREVSQMMKREESPRVVLNMVEPGFCISDLLREGTWPWYYKILMAVSKFAIGRTSEMGSRNYIWAATAGTKSHGVYVEDCMLSTPAPIAEGEEGRMLQMKAFSELAEILEGIVPQVTHNI
ncbi:hypothetical protein PG993_003010 [Apiospora rasikravindrae]|uniref:Uncharacterized protein n=1 Tax=Apiospora rasikravindrae TaxID=990691 RepID=A0ABR1TYB4_9PEZI